MATLLGVIIAPWLLYSVIQRFALARKEERILQRKYGDLPMFDGFFQRLESERRGKRRRAK